MTTDKEEQTPRGPLGHRVFIFLLSGLLTLLLIWLLGFIVRDIGDIPGPDREEIYSRHVHQELLDQRQSKQRQREAVERQITAQREIQAILERSLGNSRTTMDQLIGLHRLSLESGVTPSEAEQEALAESESLFLENQRRFQDANEQIAALSEQQRGLAEEIRLLNEQINEQEVPALEEFREAQARHNFRIASLKLAVLVPLLLIAAWIVIGHRRSPYAPILWAALIAVFWRMVLVMHKHFPEEFFKYIAIGASIVIVLAFLIAMIRMVAKPRRGWLLRQYREAYRRQRCPICAYPFPRETRGAVVVPPGESPDLSKLSTGGGESGKPFSCPACGVRLFENCPQCGAIRHSLLPHCSSCGHEREIGAAPAAGSP